jgi:hypothetical protein
MASLSQFTIILQKITRIPINGGAVLNLPPTFSPIVFKTVDTQSTGRFQTAVQAVVNENGQLVTDFPYFKVRLDDVRADPQLISILSSGPAASVVPH